MTKTFSGMAGAGVRFYPKVWLERREAQTRRAEPWNGEGRGREAAGPLGGISACVTLPESRVVEPIRRSVGLTLFKYCSEAFVYFNLKGKNIKRDVNPSPDTHSSAH